MRIGLTSIAFWVLTSSSAQSVAQEEPSGHRVDSDPQHQAILTKPIREIAGPKRTIAIGKFDAVGSFTEYYGNWDIGGGLEAMLASALVESDRFTVVERANLGEILTEQQLSTAGLSAGSTAPQAGNLAGAQLIVFGSVTEFEMREASGGFSIGLSKSAWKGGAGRQKSEGVVTMDVRLVDTSSGKVMKTHTVTEEIEAKGWDMSVGFEGISLGDNQFMQTPLGQAARGAITQAVDFIAKDANDQPWSGLVVTYEDGNIYINAGARDGVKVQDQFYIERVIRQLTDPQTGEVLSVNKKKLGEVRITGIEEKIAFGTYLPVLPDLPQRGDAVVYAK
jgi:curli biogenesis system outer membrane secretion channel CsgG